MTTEEDCSHVKPRGKDFLEVRLRRMVKAVLAEQSKSSCGYNNFITDQHKPKVCKVMWLSVFFICIGLFTYQTFDRIEYYFTYPLSVSCFIRKRSLQTFPHLTICSQETKGFFEVSSTFPQRSGCRNNLIMTALELSRKFSVEEIWKKMNTTTAVFSANTISPGLVTPLDMSHKHMMFGICTTFSQRANMPLPVDGGMYEIVLRRYNGKCESTSMLNVYLHDESRSLTAHLRREIQLGKKHDIRFSVREVKFVSLHKSSCLSAEKSQECEENCFAKYLMQNERCRQCRFPFYPDNVMLNSCNMSTKVAFIWYQAHEYLSGSDIGKLPCSCIRKCQHRIFNENYLFNMNYENQTIVTLALNNPYEILIQEELIFGIIDLLSTLGGNSGLYIGASILSFVQLITTGVIIKKKRKSHNFTLADPLYQKVVKTIQMFKSSNKMRGLNTEPESGKSNTAFKLSAVAVFAFWLFTVTNRICHFLDYPTKTFIDINFTVTLKSPEITICPGDPMVMQLQQSIAKVKNLSDFCDVKIWELFNLRIPNITSIIWENKSVSCNRAYKKTAKAFLLSCKGSSGESVRINGKLKTNVA